MSSREHHIWLQAADSGGGGGGDLNQPGTPPEPSAEDKAWNAAEKVGRAVGGSVVELKVKAARTVWKHVTKPLLGFLITLALLSGVAFCGSGSGDVGGGGVDGGFTHGDTASLAVGFLGGELHREIVRAAAVTGPPSQGGVPWTVVAALAAAATELGRFSPFDNCDRDSDRTLAVTRRADATEENCTTSQPSTFSSVEPPIANTDQSVLGPFLLVDPPSTVDPQRMVSTRQMVQDAPTTALDLVVDNLYRVRRDLEASGWVYDEDDPEGVARLWEVAVSRLAVVSPDTASGCVAPPVSWGRPVYDFANAVEQVWRCELRKAPRLYTLVEQTSSSARSSGVVFMSDPTAKLDLIVGEALQAAWSFSRWGSDQSKNRCQGVIDAEGNITYPPPWEPLGVFPLTEDVFRRFTPDQAANRCDPVANITAAVRAFIAVESVVPGSAGAARDSTPGPWAPMVGGWGSMPWVLGGSVNSFQQYGAHHLDKPGWVPDDACVALIDAGLASIEPMLTLANVSTLEAPEPDLVRAREAVDLMEPARTACAPLTEVGWTVAVADRAARWAEPPAPLNTPSTEERSTAPATPPPPPTSTTTPQGDGTSEQGDGTSQTGPAPGDPAPSQTPTTEPVETPRPVDPVKMDVVRQALLRSIARGEGRMTAAIGVDAQLPRFSFHGRIPASHPPYVPAPDAYARRVVRLAVDLGGLFPGDPTPRNDPFAGAAETPLRGGVCGIPVALANAVDTAQRLVTERWQSRFGTSRTIPADMLWGTLLNESGDLWGRIDSSGWTGVRVVTAPAVADVGGFDNRGRSRRGIIGPYMSWMPDTDQGSVDGDTSGDRAVGATQFMPSTWRGLSQRWDLDANNDGTADPHNVFDAVLGTALMFNELANAWAGDFGNQDAFLKVMSIYTGWSLDDPEDVDSLNRYLELRRQRLDKLKDCLAAVSMVSGGLDVDAQGCPLDAPAHTLIGTASRIGVNEICRKAVAGAPTPQAAAAIVWALGRLGTPYNATFRDREGWFDCSSLVARSFEAAGVPTRVSGWSPSTFHMVPANGYQPADWLVDIPRDQIRPGDLYFFDFAPRSSTGSLAGHVLISLGDGLVVEASSGRNGVVVRALRDHLPSRTVIATKRVVPPSTQAGLAPEVTRPGQ